MEYRVTFDGSTCFAEDFGDVTDAIAQAKTYYADEPEAEIRVIQLGNPMTLVGWPTPEGWHFSTQTADHDE